MRGSNISLFLCNKLTAAVLDPLLLFEKVGAIFTFSAGTTLINCVASAESVVYAY